MTPEQRKLNLGCGYRKLDDHWNVDIDPRCNPNQVVDLNQFPWPYEDNFFDRISASDVLNYLGPTPQDFERVLQEMYRVSAPDAEWYIRTMHPRCDNVWDDFYQVRVISPKTLLWLDQKRNFESLAKKTGENVYGFQLGIDAEAKEVNPSVMPYWQEQMKSGMIGQTQLEINMSTMNNIIDSFVIFMKVHKPQRFADWYQNQN